MLNNKERELNSKNYPLSFLFNEMKDVILPHATTKIMIGSEERHWEVTTDDLLKIMKEQTIIK